jgi:phospholipase C
MTETGPASRTGETKYSRRQILAGGVGLAGAGLLAGCTSAPRATTTTTTSTSSTIAPAGSDLGAVEHVVFLMQENRSFDHYFGTYRGVRGFDDRSDGALARFSQQWPDGQNAATHLLPFNLASATAQICAGNSAVPIHDWAPQHASWDNGTNERFVAVHAEELNDGPAQAPIVMGYFTRSQLAFYYSLADTFTICDNYHCSVLGPTMPNRLYGWSAFIDPSGAHGGPVLETPGFSTAADAVASVSWDTMPEALLDQGVSWKVYQPPSTSVGPNINLALALGFNSLLYFKQYLAKPGSNLYNQAFLPSWPAEFTDDVRNGTLPQVSWLLPEIAFSEHPNGSPRAGEHYVSQVLSTLMSNPDVWSKTVVFLTYDENGGFFDHVVPPTPPPGTVGEEIASSVPAVRGGGGVAGPIGLGFRVPALVISPWSRGGWVDSGTFDHTSQLRFLETRFGVEVPNLTPWRRQAVGDLTSALGLASATDGTPRLAAAPPETDTFCPSATDVLPFLSPPEPIRVPDPQSMPTQEPGTARRR